MGIVWVANHMFILHCKIKTMGLYTNYSYLIPLVYILSLFLSQIMSILNLIEAKIGSVQYWPQDILRYLFYIRRPTYFMIAEIVELLFGNKISREDALELFDVCSNF